MSISFTRLKTNSADWIAGPEVFFLFAPIDLTLLNIFEGIIQAGEFFDVRQ